MARELSEKTVGRLVTYRRALEQLRREEVTYMYSHGLAERTGVTAAQLRRDLMTVGYLGNPARGYDVQGLLESVTRFLDDPEGQRAFLVGLGNLGRALATYFDGQQNRVQIVAAFDIDCQKQGALGAQLKCYRLADIKRLATRLRPRVGVIAVPADQAADVAERLIAVGVTGILNFALLPLPPRPGVYVENVDLSVAMERVAFMARQGQDEQSVKRASAARSAERDLDSS